MENAKNRETIHFLYDSMLNKKNFDKFSEVVSADYTNTIGGKGIEGFQKTIFELSKAFPNAQWEVEEIIVDGNKVMVKQKFIGTQTNSFQNIKPTYKTVSVDGIATYELQNGKIIRSQVQTDRLGFFQQLGVLPTDLSTVSNKNEERNAVYFIDRISVPKTSRDEFFKQMTTTNAFIKSLPGYIRNEVLERYDHDGNSDIMTVAVWEDEDKLNNAKIAVQNEFKRMGFNPMEFFNRLTIKIERGQYAIPKE